MGVWDGRSARSALGAARAEIVLAIAAMTLSGLATAGPASAQGPIVTPSCGIHAAAGQYRCFALRRTDVRQALALGVAATPPGYGPADLRGAYRLPASTTTATIAIVDAYDDPTAEADLKTYRSVYGLPACTTANGCFRKVNQSGAAGPLPVRDAGWAGEISLDLDMASAICPTCHLLLVEANDPSDNLFSAVERARLMGAKYISMSWGGSEFGVESAYDAKYFNHPGVVYTASSGDDGYAGGVGYPSTSQYVVSVGGTTLQRPSGAGGWTESAWAGAGSGCSSSVARPAFQGGVTPCARRADTDVSAVANPSTGVAVYQTYGAGGWTVYGGTSVSAPIIAGVYALAGVPRPGDRPAAYPYGHRGNLNDVIGGGNGTCSPSVLCHAVAGWDGPTGLGTPNGTAAFKGADAVTVTNPGSQVVVVNRATSLAIHAADSAPGQTLAYRATGLPPGLAIGPATGGITGTPTSTGTYHVTVTATDSTQVSGSAAFTWTVSGGSGAFVSLPPARVLDTRTGNGAPKVAVRAGHSVTVQITGRGGVPRTGASTVAIAVSVVRPGAGGWLTAAAYGTTGAKATVVSFVPNQNVTDLALVPLGTGGKIVFTNHSRSTLHLTGDLSGYFVAGSPTIAGAFAARPPVRLLDTRTGNGARKAAIRAHAAVTFQVTGRGGVGSTALAVALAITVVSPARDGSLTASAHGVGTRKATVVSFRHGQNSADLAIIPVRADGRVTLTNNSASTIQLVGDLAGYFLRGRTRPAMSGAFAALSPARVLDTRTGNGAPRATVKAGRAVTVRIAGRGGVPATGASAVVIAIGALQPAAAGSVTVTSGASTATIAYFAKGQSLTVTAVVALGASGVITLTNHSSAAIQLAADVSGYHLA